MRSDFVDHFVAQDIVRFQNSIVPWFKKNARDLPWRKTSDPYKIWISEMMLQQTTVSTVIPYYNNFLQKFPSVHDLARAREDDVLRAWEGLGYYQRAKNLLKGAQFIVEKYGGVIPETRDALLEIPGIGPYSSGAILSIAFRKSTAALDGNLIRVYSRFFAIEDDVGQPDTLKKLWKVAEKIAPQGSDDSREFAEGMMELGATICTPRNTKCIECPLNKKCLSYKHGLVSILPKKLSKKVRRKHYEEVFLVERQGKIAFFKTGTDSKYQDFSRLPFCQLKKPREGPPEFRYSVTTRDFYVWKREKLTGTMAARVSWIEREKVAELLLPAIDRKILKTLPGVFEKRADRHGSNASRNRRSR